MTGMIVFSVLIIIAILWVVMQSEKVAWFLDDDGVPWPRHDENTFGDDG